MTEHPASTPGGPPLRGEDLRGQIRREEDVDGDAIVVRPGRGIVLLEGDRPNTTTWRAMWPVVARQVAYALLFAADAVEDQDD